MPNKGNRDAEEQLWLSPLLNGKRGKALVSPVLGCLRGMIRGQQAAPGLKVTSKAFGIGRRFPIAQRYLESE